MAEFCEPHLNRGIKVIATRDDGMTQRCEECYRGQPIKENRKEGESFMPPATSTTTEEIKALHAQNLKPSEIAGKLGISYQTVHYHLKKIGTATTPKLAVRSSVNPAEPKREMLAPVAPAPPVAAEPIAAEGKARARVVMFELEGSDATVIGAIETIKAALGRA